MTIEVAYATPDKQALVSLPVPLDTTAEQAIHASGLLAQFPEIDLEQTKVGVFGVLCNLDHSLKHGDRVEIYRPLMLDPKAARLQRAKK
ncbi:RnfH family protein [Crenothrix sp.]|uniref:RnfH family protein n=1 Tax=Crenothrix sp. TaxID=3100433 RepID=UPI00374CC85B